MKNQLKLLLSVTKLLTSNNIEYWLDFGTLLGAIREKAFLKHDMGDIDIGVNQKDYWKVRKILNTQTTLKYKRIWRTEISIYETSDVHLDLFFFTEKDNMMHTALFLGNKIQGGLNIESGMKYLKENIYPLKNINVFHHRFTVPNNPEAHLVENYGEDWKTPDTKWWHGKHKSIDDTHRTIGILIPTFLRDEKMMKSVESILRYTDKNDMFRKWVRLYIADQGNPEWSQEKTDFYNKLKVDGHKIFKTPFNSGLSYNRNFLVQQSTEPYVMIIDDDFKFTDKTDLTALIEILNHREENGIVGGDISNRPSYHSEFLFEKKGEELFLQRITRVLAKQKVQVHSTRCNPEYDRFYNYQYTDIVLNFFLAKREVLEKIPLDNNLKLVEHSDHFLRIKKDGQWKVCYYPHTTCEHISGKNSDEYKNFRNNHNYIQMFLDKWGLKDMKHIQKIFEIDIKNVPYKDIIDETKKIKVVQIARIPCANSGYELSKLINTYSNNYESRYILGGEYGKHYENIPYRQFPYDLFWKENKKECIKAIEEADIVHIHHDSWAEIEPYLKGKKVISTLYNLTQSLQYNNNTFNKNYINKLKSFGSMTVADQPLQKKMFNDISTTYVPLIKMLFGINFTKKAEAPITIGFSPTNRENVGIGSKRFGMVMACINELKEKYSFDFKLIEGMPYEENLKEKAMCDILIDDVDDSYEKAHNTTCEAALLNAVPLTNYSGDWFPALKTDINSLKSTLEDFILHPKKIDEYRKNVLKPWRMEVYTPQNLLQIYETLYKEEIEENKPIFKTVVNKEIINPVAENASIKEEFRLLDTYLHREHIEYCLIKTSCLDAIRFGELRIKPNDLYIAVKNTEKIGKILKLLKLKLNVHLSGDFPNQIKQIGFFGVARNIPFPVIPYLSNLYGAGQKWRKFGIDTEE